MSVNVLGHAAQIEAQLDKRRSLLDQRWKVIGHLKEVQLNPLKMKKKPLSWYFPKLFFRIPFMIYTPDLFFHHPFSFFLSKLKEFSSLSCFSSVFCPAVVIMQKNRALRYQRFCKWSPCTCRRPQNKHLLMSSTACKQLGFSLRSSPLAAGASVCDVIPSSWSRIYSKKYLLWRHVASRGRRMHEYRKGIRS